MGRFLHSRRSRRQYCRSSSSRIKRTTVTHTGMVVQAKPVSVVLSPLTFCHYQTGFYDGCSYLRLLKASGSVFPSTFSQRRNAVRYLTTIALQPRKHAWLYVGSTSFGHFRLPRAQSINCVSLNPVSYRNLCKLYVT